MHFIFVFQNNIPLHFVSIAGPNTPQKLRLCNIPPTCAVQQNVQLFAKSGLSVQQSRSLYTFFKYNFGLKEHKITQNNCIH